MKFCWHDWIIFRGPTRDWDMLTKGDWIYIPNRNDPREAYLFNWQMPYNKIVLGSFWNKSLYSDLVCTKCEKIKPRLEKRLRKWAKQRQKESERDQKIEQVRGKAIKYLTLYQKANY